MRKILVMIHDGEYFLALVAVIVNLGRFLKLPFSMLDKNLHEDSLSALVFVLYCIVWICWFVFAALGTFETRTSILWFGKWCIWIPALGLVLISSLICGALAAWGLIEPLVRRVRFPAINISFPDIRGIYMVYRAAIDVYPVPEAKQKHKAKRKHEHNIELMPGEYLTTDEAEKAKR